MDDMDTANEAVREISRFDQEHLSTWEDSERTIQLTRGDCFRACMAMLISEYDPTIELSDVPHFFGDISGSRAALDLAWDSVRSFFAERGLFLFSCDLIAANWKHGNNPICRLHSLMAQDKFYVLGGESPRSPKERHAIVMRGSEMFHDPHPSRSGIWSLNTLYLVWKDTNSELA